MKAFLQRNGIHGFLIFASLLLTCYSINVQAEYRQGDRNSKINIKGRDIPVQRVFDAIRRQSGLYVMYNVGVVGLRREDKVTVNFKDTRLDEVLSFIFNVSKYEWVYNDNAVVVRAKGVKKNDVDSSITTTSIMGTVTDAEGKPLPGATVLVKGTKQGASTDVAGNFSMPDVKLNSVLVISSIGFESREISVKGKTILAQLKLDVNNLDEAVVVAYNTTTQRANTGAVTVVQGQQVQNLPNRSFDRSLQGLVPGLLVTSGTGQPGGGVSNFVLRGIATAADVRRGGTPRNPLIIIDGVPVTQDHAQLYIDDTDVPVSNPLAQLNPSDVETISVLKDAAAIALYGSRASNGVVVITTKRGKEGKTVFGFRHQTDIARRLDGKSKYLNQPEYLELLYESCRNADPSMTDDQIKADLQSKFPTHPDGSFYPATDWDKEIFNNTAVTVSNDISVSGGNERTRFYLNLEYTKQNGVLKETGYDRKSLRFNFENRPTKWLKLGLNTTLSYNVQEYGGNHTGAGGPTSPYFSPLNPVRTVEGEYVWNYNWGGTAVPQPNPVAAAAFNINRNTAFRGLGKLYGEVSFLKYLTFTCNLGFDYMQSEAKEKVDPRLYDPSIYDIGGKIEEKNTRRANVITTNILRFDRTFSEDHVVGIVLGQEAQVLSQKYLQVGVKGLSMPYYEEITSPGVSVFRQEGATAKETLLSLFGQANYGFRNKYFLSASVRRDGSSRFGEDRRYGTYWSTGAGWVLSSEPFMKSTDTWLSYLKIRGSIGAAGNAAAINALTRFDQLQSNRYVNGIAVYPMYAPGNPDVRWEQTFTWDAGLEIQLLQGRISATADIYKRKTRDLLYNMTLPLNTGYVSVLTNVGKMENKGIELSLSADILKTKDFRWNLNANWSTNKNILVKADVPAASLGVGVLGNKEGQNFNSFYMKQWSGVNPVDGTPQWVDSAGKPTGDYFAAKMEFVGKPQPDGFGAITNTVEFKGFELSAMLYYQYGYQIYYQSDLLNDGAKPYLNQDRGALDRWQKPGDQARNPRRMLNNVDGGIYPSTRYLFDGSHIRLQNVTLAYTFSKIVLDRFHLSYLRIFVQGQNLALWTKFPGNDPGSVNTLGEMTPIYPNQRSFSIGLNANF